MVRPHPFSKDMRYTKDNPLRCFFAFEGYNSQGLALRRLAESFPGFAWECVGRSEIDADAIRAADLLFPESAGKNYGSICDVDWDTVPDIDLFTWSFPCTAISSAGKQEGLTEGSGTASSLLWHCFKAFEKKRPKYLLMENVKALMQKKFAGEFCKILRRLEDLGYKNFYQVLNATDYGIPQNRERVFMLSILGGQSYNFPLPFPLEKRLRDVLEDDVDERYYLKDEQVKSILDHCNRKQAEGCGFKPNFAPPQSVSGTITSKYGGRQTDPYVIHE